MTTEDVYIVVGRNKTSSEETKKFFINMYSYIVICDIE